MHRMFDAVHLGGAGSRFITTDIGQPAKRVLTTVFIGTRLTNGSIERGIGIEYVDYRGSRDKFCIFSPMESKNPKEYLRAFDLVEHMEKVDPDTLEACVHASKKQASTSDSHYGSLKKYQPTQLAKIFAKRAVVFENPYNQELIKSIVSEFARCGSPVDDPFQVITKKERVVASPKKDVTQPWIALPRIIDSMSTLPLGA